jgi:CRP-like cAMP-binding protein
MPASNSSDGGAGAEKPVDPTADDTQAGAGGAGGAGVSGAFGECGLEPGPGSTVSAEDLERLDPERPRSAVRGAAARGGPARDRPLRRSAERRTFRDVEDLAEAAHKSNGNLKRVDPGVQLRCETGARTKQVVILSGWASQMQTLPDGRRQIFSLLLPGDAILMDERGERMGRGVVALTRLTVMETGYPLLAEGDAWMSLQRGFRETALRNEKRLMDHMVRIGRLDARERVLHLLLELYERLDAVGLVKDDTFRMPLTQEALADTLGLSAVHINRTLRELNREGCIRLKHRLVTLPEREKLAALTFYRPTGI